jgi:hypothetical protein
LPQAHTPSHSPDSVGIGGRSGMFGMPQNGTLNTICQQQEMVDSAPLRTN